MASGFLFQGLGKCAMMLGGETALAPRTTAYRICLENQRTYPFFCLYRFSVSVRKSASRRRKMVLACGNERPLS